MSPCSRLIFFNIFIFLKSWPEPQKVSRKFKDEQCWLQQCNVVLQMVTIYVCNFQFFNSHFSEICVTLDLNYYFYCKMVYIFETSFDDISLYLIVGFDYFPDMLTEWYRSQIFILTVVIYLPTLAVWQFAITSSNIYSYSLPMICY